VNRIERMLDCAQSVTTYRENTWVAGGLLRDYILDRKPKDVDIYTTNPELESILSKGSTRGASSFKPRGKEYAYTMNGIKQVYSVEFPELIADIIVLAPGVGDFERWMRSNFDADICKVWWDGSQLHLTEEFERDVRNKTITYHPEAPSNNDHIERIMKKYPDFRPNPCPVKGVPF